MKKLYSYMFPISLGAFALVATPVADSNLVISVLILVGVVTLWLGITSVAKKADENEQKMNALLNSIEHQTEVVREAVTELRQNGEVVATGLQNMHDVASELNKSSQENVEAMKSNTEAITEQLSKLKESNQNDIQEIVKKQDGLLRLAEELVEIQNEIPNGFKELQDSISQANDDQIEVMQGLETHIYEMKNGKESYHEQLLELNGKIIDTVNTRVENLSMYIQEEATTLMKRSEDAQVLALKEVEAFGTLIKQIEELNQQMQHVSKHNQEASVKELERLTEISAALLEGISQLTNSKSAERKKILLVQKKLIEKFAD
ncbi:hypothetical protein [Exiguobacterium chiriqhucha]|uniref:Uncharacterized protein n=1 Tax=Exiguobacterium chiriqhucha RW-2 TaxID=1345023 RepID=U1LZ82_9BACL|nr:hypothetical protein [Exiguobacterium chiriqhucha]ERG68039.1 hypothetical protein M467_12180 [Exiguobacterium chiriqhucha RW-2]